MRGDGDATVVLGISLAKSSPALWLLNKAENVNGGPKIVGLKLPHKNDNLESTWTSPFNVHVQKPPFTSNDSMRQ
jgi:hypothetical protein